MNIIKNEKLLCKGYKYTSTSSPIKQSLYCYPPTPGQYKKQFIYYLLYFSFLTSLPRTYINQNSDSKNQNPSFP